LDYRFSGAAYWRRREDRAELGAAGKSDGFFP
jgi:hypothetical protein